MNQSCKWLIIGTVSLIIGCAQVSVAQSIQLAPHTETQSADGKITNIEAKGNLESTHDLGCIAIEQVSNKYTPADLYKAYGRCVQANDFDKAITLFIIAGAYGHFDQMRVTDVSAHQAVKVLIMT